MDRKHRTCMMQNVPVILLKVDLLIVHKPRPKPEHGLNSCAARAQTPRFGGPMSHNACSGPINSREPRESIKQLISSSPAATPGTSDSTLKYPYDGGTMLRTLSRSQAGSEDYRLLFGLSQVKIKICQGRKTVQQSCKICSKQIRVKQGLL